MTEIVPYAAHHLDGMLDVILTIQQDEFAIPITGADQPDLLSIPTFYQRDNGNFWVAVDDGAVVGTISLLDIGNRQGALRKMFVRASHRGKAHRVAGRLLDTLLDWSRVRLLQSVYLGTTDKFLAAHRFYEKNGFVAVAKSELPAAFPVMAVDSKFYLRQLK